MTLSDVDFNFLSEMLERETAIRLGPDKKYFAEARLKPLAKKHFGESLPDLVTALRNGGNGVLCQDVLEALAINETYFFRDPPVFDSLRKKILPDLIERRKKEKKLHIWWPACSTGEDPYSFCMMIHDEFPELREWDIILIASDFSRWILEYAKNGSYSISQVNRGLSARQLMSFFEQDGLNWRLKSGVRGMVDFWEVNLIKEWPAFPQFDLVALRNVMIYFDATVRKNLLSRIAATMMVDGYLILGATETVSQHAAFKPAIAGSHLPCYNPVRQELYSLKESGT